MALFDGLRKKKSLSRDVGGSEAGIKRSRLIRSVSAGLDDVSKEATVGKSERQERIQPGVPVQRLELIYKLDGQIFGIINKFVRDIIGPGFMIYGQDEESKRTIEEFCDNKEIGFERMLRIAVRDSLIYGNAFFELAYTRQLNDIVQIIPIDPKTMDFQRDNMLFIARDEEGKPIGYEQQPTTVNKIKFPLENIAHFAFYPLGDTELGMSPLEPLYKPVLYKLNIEDAVGEVYAKGAYPLIIATVGDDKNYPSSEEMSNMEKSLTNISSKSAFVVPPWINIKRMESGRLERVHPTEELSYFNNLISDTLGSPRPDKVDFEDYERTVISLQEILAEQIESQIFARLIKVKGLGEVPRIKFTEITPSAKLSRNRRRAVLFRYGALTWDAKLEQFLRKEEGLPPLDENMTPEEVERRSYVQPRRARHLTKEDLEDE